MATPGFHRLDSGHQELVLGVDYNIDGTRMATASSDHRVRVWERNENSDDVWHPVDFWVAHDAEVTDVRWNGPFVGEHLISIGEDGFVRVWHEDVNAAMDSGRRFKKIFERPSDTGVPFMALDLKNVFNETYLAVITRDGLLSVFEPEDQDDLSAWRTLWSEQICRPPPRTEESGFKLCWHKEPIPAWPAVLAGLDRKSLSLAVAVGDAVKILRTDKDRAFFVAATLDGAKGLIQHVDWANGSLRGFDIIAAASKDGFIRIYEVHTPGAASLSTSAHAQANHTNHGLINGHSHRPIRSGIGAGIANGARNRRDENSTGIGTVKQDSKLVAEFEAHEDAPWRVNWSGMGDILVSTGDEGSVRMWIKAVDGKWLEAAEVDATRDI